MSSPEINQVLAQMRVARAQVEAGVQPNPSEETSFGDLLKRSIDAVNETQQGASALRTAFEKGADDLSTVTMIMAATANSSLKMTTLCISLSLKM